MEFSNQTILGMDAVIFIIVATILVFIIVLFFLLYLSIVFVKPGYAKIVERFGKFYKIIYSPRGFIVPIIDKIACELDVGALVYNSNSKITIIGANDKLFKITFGLTYFIINPSCYYKEGDKIMDRLDGYISKVVIDYFNKKSVQSFKEIYDCNNNLLIEYLSELMLKYSIKIDDFVIRTIE